MNADISLTVLAPLFVMPILIPLCVTLLPIVSVAVQGWLVDFLTGFSVPGTLHYYSPEYRHSYNLLPLYDNYMVAI